MNAVHARFAFSLSIAAAIFVSGCGKGSSEALDGGASLTSNDASLDEGTTFCTQPAQKSALFCADFDGISLVTGWSDTSQFEGIYLTSDSKLSTSNYALVALPAGTPSVTTDRLGDTVTLNSTQATLAFDLYALSATNQATFASVTFTQSDATVVSLGFSLDSGNFLVGSLASTEAAGTSIAQNKWVHVVIAFQETAGGSTTPEGVTKPGLSFSITLDGAGGGGGSFGGSAAPITSMGLGIGFCGGSGAASYAIDNVVLTSP